MVDEVAIAVLIGLRRIVGVRAVVAAGEVGRRIHGVRKTVPIRVWSVALAVVVAAICFQDMGLDESDVLGRIERCELILHPSQLRDETTGNAA